MNLYFTYFIEDEPSSTDSLNEHFGLCPSVILQSGVHLTNNSSWMHSPCATLRCLYQSSIPGYIKQAIEDELDRMEIEQKDVQGESAVGKMRVMMTYCMGHAWSEFSYDRQEVVIKCFLQLGLSLPINGSSDGKISIKGLETLLEFKSKY
ncbi:hypothetical protein HOY80DRAFT_1036596 [Tuber brumale]|nr:hypothetical protein HOY80DRAFT_1036596 [Tuber brumale]